MMRNLLCCGIWLSSFLCVPTLIFGQKSPQDIEAARSRILSDSKVLSVEFGRIYPNPSTGNEIFVNITTAETKKIRIEYVSSSGQLISWQQKVILPGTSRVTLKNQALAYGTYLIRFRDEDDRILDVQSFIRN